MNAMHYPVRSRVVDVVWMVLARDWDEFRYSHVRGVPTMPGHYLKLVGIFYAIENTGASHSWQLDQNYPNPFHPSTTIHCKIDRTEHIVLRVFNLMGEEVDVLHEGFLSAGDYQFRFQGNGMPNGVYHYRLETENGSLTRQMLLLR